MLNKILKKILKKYILVTNVQKKIKCKKTFRSHVSNSHGEGTKCTLCDKTFKSSLNRYINIKHKIAYEKWRTYACSKENEIKNA